MKFFLFKIAFIYFMCICNSQNYELSYRLTEFKEINFSKDLSKEQMASRKNKLNDLKNYATGFQLNIISNSKSYYFDIPDKLENDFNTNPYLKLLYLGMMGLDESLLFLDNSKYYKNKVEPFITNMNHNIVSWMVRNNKIKVGKYDCFEAIPIVNTDANLGSSVMGLKIWFTNQINLKGGPTRYGNLPGLIVALENKYVKFELVGIKETNTSIPSIEEFTGKKKIKSFEDSVLYHRKIGKMIENN